MALRLIRIVTFLQVTVLSVFLALESYVVSGYMSWIRVLTEAVACGLYINLMCAIF